MGRSQHQRWVTHCLPLSLLVLLVFHRFIRAPLMAVLGLRSGEDDDHRFELWPASRLLVIVVSVALGALSHIAGDASSHSHGWAVERVAFLRATLLGLPGYKLVQYSGGVLGLVAVVGWVYVAARASHRRREADSMAWDVRLGLLLACFVFMISMAVFAVLWHADRGMSVESIAVRAAIGAVAGLALWCMALGVVWRLLPGARTGSPPSVDGIRD